MDNERSEPISKVMDGDEEVLLIQCKVGGYQKIIYDLKPESERSKHE